MKIGLLWFDDNPDRSLTEKIARAAKRYRQKYGAPPNTCYVHHNELGGNGKTAHVANIHVAVLPNVLQHHLWIGVEQCTPDEQ